jgi:hypothetical protein
MNVYLLMEEIDQSEFTNCNESAEPISSVLGVYKDRDKAEREKKRLDEENMEAVKTQNADPVAYFIEERPVL